MSIYIQPIFGLRQDKALAASLATPSASTDGVDTTGWRPFSGMGWTQAVVALTADGAATVSSVALYAYGPYGIAGAKVWLNIGSLNSGADISLTATAGWGDSVTLPSVFDRLAVAGTVTGGNNVGYTLTPAAEVQ